MEKILLALATLLFTVFHCNASEDMVRLGKAGPHDMRGHCTYQKGTYELTLCPPQGKSSAWISFDVESENLLNDYKYIELEIKSLDNKNHNLCLTLFRNLSKNDHAQFDSIVTITPQWKTVALELKSGTRAMAILNHFFYFVRGTKGSNSSLTLQGNLQAVSFCAWENVLFAFRNLRLTNKNSDTGETKEYLSAIRRHEKSIPYAFKETIRKNAVSLDGFTITIGENATKTEIFAAGELAKYLNMATGKTFPVTSRNTPGKKIFELRVIPAKPEEAFHSESIDGKKVSIIGNSPRALLYAVYDFLEKAAGIRWFAPFEWGEIVPFNPNLKIPLFKDQEAPCFSYRRPHYCADSRTAGFKQHIWDMADWTVKNRFNVELGRLPKTESTDENIKTFYDIRGGSIPLHGQCFYHQHLPPSKYFKDHPAWFCYDKATGKYRAKSAQICNTNPEVINKLSEIADEYFRKHPDLFYFPLMQEDGFCLWCQCEKCLALCPDGSNVITATDQQMYMANVLSRRIREKNPGKSVLIFAYTWTKEPPQKVKPAEGVWILFCEASNYQALLEWNKLVSGRIIVYTYHYLNPCFSESPTFGTVASHTEHFRFLNLLNIQGVCEETMDGWAGADAFQHYLGARLAWNPWFNDTLLKNDYFNKLYGPAGNIMENYYSLLEQVLAAPSARIRYGYLTVPVFTEEQLQIMENMLNQAEKQAEHDKRVQCVLEREKKYWTYLKQHSSFIKAANHFYDSPNQKSYDTIIPQLKEIRKMLDHLISQKILPGGHKEGFYGTNRFTIFKQLLDNETVFRNLKEKYNLENILNPWKFKTDFAAAGDKEKWFDPNLDDSKWDTIKSGKFWEDQGYIFDGPAWYRKTIEIKSGKRYSLYFGGADEHAWLWLDGKYIGGHHKGDAATLWREPFIIRLPENMSPGKHQLTVKVIDAAGKGGLYKDVFLMSAK